MQNAGALTALCHFEQCCKFFCLCRPQSENAETKMLCYLTKAEAYNYALNVEKDLTD